MSKSKKRMSLAEFNQEEKGVIWLIVDHATNLPVTLYAESLGIKVPEAIYRSGIYSVDSTRLIGETYLLNAKRSSLEMGLPHGVFNYSSSIGVKGALSHRKHQEEDIVENKMTIQLPRYLPLNESIGSVIRSRRSVRSYSGKPLSMEQLSTLLYYGDGPSGDFDFNTNNDLPTTASLGSEFKGVVRTAPSGGGLYPITMYFVAVNVENLQQGVYKYLPLNHTIVLVKPFEKEDMDQYLQMSNFGINIDSSKVGIAIYYVYSLYDNARKYGDMAVQFAFIEAGEIAENVQLTANALNLAASDIGGYEKGLTETFFGLDGLTKHVIHLTLVGSRN